MLSDTNSFLNRIYYRIARQVKAKREVNLLTSRIIPLDLPLPMERGTDWKPHFLFGGRPANMDHITCHVSYLTYGKSPHTPHRHPEEEILFVLKGEVDLILPADGSLGVEKRRRLTEGEFVYYPNDFPHSLETVSKEPANYLMIKWSNTRRKRKPQVPFQHFGNIFSEEGTIVSQGFSIKKLFEGSSSYLSKIHSHASQLSHGAGYEAHSDDHDVVILIRRGEVETLGKRIGPNGVIYYLAGEEHGMFNPGKEPAQYIVFSFHGIRKNRLNQLFSK